MSLKYLFCVRKFYHTHYTLHSCLRRRIKVQETFLKPRVV